MEENIGKQKKALYMLIFWFAAVVIVMALGIISGKAFYGWITLMLAVANMRPILCTFLGCENEANPLFSFFAGVPAFGVIIAYGFSPRFLEPEQQTKMAAVTIVVLVLWVAAEVGFSYYLKKKREKENAE